MANFNKKDLLNKEVTIRSLGKVRLLDFTELPDTYVKMTAKTATEVVAEFTEYAETFLREHYGITLRVPIVLNGRLRACDGRYCYTEYRRGSQVSISPQRVEMAKSYVEINGVEASLPVLRHELIHYALSVTGKPFDDRDQIFIDECRRLDAPLGGEQAGLNKRVVIGCFNCGSVGIDRKDTTKGYVCGKCRGSLHNCGNIYL